MSSEPTRIALFAKAPVPGRVKTRLGRDVGDVTAAALYAAFLRDLVERLGRPPDLEVVLWAASDDDVGPLEALGPRVEVQPTGDLGHRMHAAMRASLEERPRVIVLGSDAPTLPLSRVRAAAAALGGAGLDGAGLHGADLVLGPAADGGYTLIGATSAFAFGTRIRWSTEHALADTLREARLQGRRVARVRPMYDIDTVADLRLLRLDLAMQPARAPRTAAALQRLHPF